MKSQTESKEISDSRRNVLVIKNSFCRLVNFPKDVMAEIDSLLTYQNDIEAERASLLTRIKFFKSLKDSEEGSVRAKAKRMMAILFKELRELEENEFVHWLNGDEFPTGLSNIVEEALIALDVEFTKEDTRVIPERRHNFRLREAFPEPRYYQAEMHELGLQAGRGVFESAVGTGKSLVMMRLIEALGANSLVVVPSVPLAVQLTNDLKKFFGERNVCVVSSKTVASEQQLRKMRKTPIRITNIQSLASLNKKGEVGKLIQDVEAIFVDEIHHAGSKSYTDLLPQMEHIYYRFGFTGTFLRNDEKTLDMWGFLSNKLYCYPAHKAISEGYLTPVKIVWHELQGIKKRTYQSEYKANYCVSDEMMDKIVEIVSSVSENEQVLILVAQKERGGKVISEMLAERGFRNTFISGDTPKEEVRETLQAFNERRIQILLGSAVIGEGIDIRSTDHLIMAQGGKSEIVMVQALGRAVRLFRGKTKAYVHDFIFTSGETKYMAKHAIVRKDIYKRNFQV